MTDLGRQAQQLTLLLEPLAAMMVKKIHPVRDDLTKNAACREYGRGWIEEHIRNGDLTPRIKGQQHIFSRAEIEALRAVSMQAPQVFVKENTGRRRGK